MRRIAKKLEGDGGSPDGAAAAAAAATAADFAHFRE